MPSFCRLSGHDGKSLLFEMVIKGKNGLYSRGAHELKADTVHKTERVSRCGQKGCDAGAVHFRGNKLNINKREDVLLKSTYGFQSETVLHKGKGLYENVITCYKPMLSPEQLSPYLCCLLVIGIIPVKQGIECRGIVEDSHVLNAS